jgi:caa(3)-type oxidase subunit IV
MTATAHAPAQETSHDPGHAHAPHRNYVKIWGILVLLLVVSVVGPMFGIRWVMLVTAFGVALVKAYMVAKNFMHLDIEKPIVHWILLVALALMVLLYGALAPDVQKGAGQGWKKDAGFHHSFTTSKPHEEGEHKAPAGTPAAPEQPEHGKP